MEIEFHAAHQNLMLYDVRFIFKILTEVRKQLVGILNHLYILADNPDNGSLGLWVIQ
jgi:hypothetical protein